VFCYMLVLQTVLLYALTRMCSLTYRNVVRCVVRLLDNNFTRMCSLTYRAEAEVGAAQERHDRVGGPQKGELSYMLLLECLHTGLWTAERRALKRPHIVGLFCPSSRSFLTLVWSVVDICIKTMSVRCVHIAKKFFFLLHSWRIHICIKTMSEKGGICDHEAYEAK
jgi:hypothetical protein